MDIRGNRELTLGGKTADIGGQTNDIWMVIRVAVGGWTGDIGEHICDIRGDNQVTFYFYDQSFKRSLIKMHLSFV